MDTSVTLDRVTRLVWLKIRVSMPGIYASVNLMVRNITYVLSDVVSVK